MPTTKGGRRPRLRPSRRNSCCESGAAGQCCASPGAISRGPQPWPRHYKPCPTWPTPPSVQPRAAAELHLQPIFGKPHRTDPAQSPFIVLGMGKLGGRELNFSSDIDLVFLFAEPGETTGPRVIDNEEYFNRLGREIIRLLDARNADGFVFRVDMRLRPFGESGPLVVSLASLEDYLQQHGRDWERYAWIKARAIVGAGRLRGGLPGIRAPFRLPALSGFRRVRILAQHEGFDRARGGAARSGASLEARQRRHSRDRVHRAIPAAGARRQRSAPAESRAVARCCRCLPVRSWCRREDIAELTAAYLVLRKAENALQMMRDEQTHTSAGGSARSRAPGVNMGCRDWAAASEHLHRLSTGWRRNSRRCCSACRMRSAAATMPAWRGWTPTMSRSTEELANSGFPDARDSGCCRDFGVVPAGRALSTPGRGGSPASLRDFGAIAQKRGAACIARRASCSGCCACWKQSARAPPIWHCSRSSRRRWTGSSRCAPSADFCRGRSRSFRCCSTS